MKRAISLGVLIFSAGLAAAGPMRGAARKSAAAAPTFALVTPQAAQAALAMLNAPQISGSSRGELVGALRGIDANLSKQRQRLAPVVEAMANVGVKPGAPLDASLVDLILAQAVALAEERSQSLRVLALREEDPELVAVAAKRMEGYHEAYGAYLPSAESAALRQAAEAANRWVADSRGSVLMGKARRTADALGRTGEDDAAGVPESRRPGVKGSALSKADIASQVAGRTEPPSSGKPSNNDAEKKGLSAIYYIGGGMIVAGLTWFLAGIGLTFGAAYVAAIAAAYAVLFYGVGAWLAKKSFATAAGLLATSAVLMVPVAIAAMFGADRLLDSSDNLTALMVFLPTIAAAVAAARRFRFALLAIPAVIAALGAVFTLTAMLGIGAVAAIIWVPTITGAALIIASRWIDKISGGVSYSFWMDLAGLGVSWAGWMALAGEYGHMGNLIWGLLNLGLVALSVRLDRKVFAVFGALGFFGYLANLAWGLFAGSVVFPLVLALIGIAMIAGVVLLQRYARRRGTA